MSEREFSNQALASFRSEASNPTTPPHRLQELISLEGDRGMMDSPSGWCREDVASNPSATSQLLDELSRDTNDFVVRLNVARNLSTRDDTLHTLVGDPNEHVAREARKRLNIDEPVHSSEITGAFWWRNAYMKRISTK